MARRKNDVNLKVDEMEGGMLKSRPLEGFAASAWEIHEIIFENGDTPVSDFLDSLNGSEAAAFAARIERLLRGAPFTPSNNFKMYEGIWQIRTNDHRILGFQQGRTLLLVTNGFRKTTKKTPPQEIARCKALKERFESEAKLRSKLEVEKGPKS